jgi:dTDP-4-dehydrorhamnose 3,5-epimerase
MTTQRTSEHMIFAQAGLADIWLIELQPNEDARGSFARAYCEDMFLQHGLNTRWKQINHSYSRRPGTLRGLHYQRGSHAEIKLVRCLRGAVYDVVVDLRPVSPSRHQWLGVSLSADRPNWIYVPRGFAHGFLTLTPDTEMEYMVSAPYAPSAQMGFRYNDPYFDIAWPREVVVLSPQDESWPAFDPIAGDPCVIDEQ